MTVQHSTRPSGGRGTVAKWTLLVASRWSPAIFTIVCIALISLVAREGLVNLYNRWMFEEEYDYGILVAVLVPLLLFGRRRAIRALSTRATWPGLLLVLIAQLCAILGDLGESYFVEQLAFVFSLLGLVLVVFGPGPLRIFAPLTVLLLLTIPLPYTLQAILTINLQLISTNIGASIVSLLGIPVFVEGNIVDLGQYQLQVAEACSGLRYLLPLTCISFMVAFLYKAALWKRAVLVVSAVPITILINSLRIAITAILVNNFGSGMATGFFHWFEGWVIFCVGAAFLIIEILALEKFSFRNVNIEPIFSPDSPSISPATARISLGASAVATLFICLAAFGAASSIASALGSAPKPSRENFGGFPRQIGDWIGHAGRLDPTTLETLRASDYYVGDFSKAKGPPVNVFVAYYDTLNKGGAIHSPRVCLPGAGWEFSSFEEKDFAELFPGGGTFNRVVIQKGTEKMLMYYWIQQRERRTANEFSMKYYLLLDNLTKSRKDGALVRLLTPISTGGARDEQEADDRLHVFAQSVLPKMSDYLPP